MMIGSAIASGGIAARMLPVGAMQPALAPFTSVAPDGWRVDYVSIPVTPDSTKVARPGFDSKAGVITIADDLLITSRVREAFPNQNLLSPSTAALANYVHVNDTIAGAQNQSVVPYPKPVANWSMLHRSVVGNSLRLSLVAFHHYARVGKQVAAVKFIASDGTQSVSAIISETASNVRPGDQQPVVEYEATLDISALGEGLITVNAEIYPHVGEADAILKSTGQIAAREFSPRYFLKNVNLASAPPMAYIAANGNDASGIVSTDPATAKATPFASFSGAWAGIRVARANQMQGTVIRIGAGNFPMSAVYQFYNQDHAATTIERDPEIPRDQAIVSFGSSAFRPLLRLPQSPLTTTALRFRDITITRTGPQTITGEGAANLEIFFENVVFRNNGHNATLLSNSHLWASGMEITGGSASVLAPGVSEIRMLRGVRNITMSGTQSVDGWLVLGAHFGKGINLQRGTRSFSGAVYAFNRFMGVSSTASPVAWGAAADATGCALVQNIFEYVSTVAAPTVRITADNASGNVENIIIHHNAFAGFNNHGRANLFYEDGATPRSSNMISARGNIHVQVNCKSDVFVADGTRTGNWVYRYGVGSLDEFSQFRAADGSVVGQGASFSQDYAGPGANYRISGTISNDPLFRDDRSYNGSSAGTGSGDYRLQAVSPCKGTARSAVLSHDLAGTERPLTGDSRGPYV